MEPGLDHAFLRYTGVTPENQIPVRRFYLPMFAGCRRVVDLGCGQGTFVSLLNEAGIETIGVDSDPATCADLRTRHVPVVEADVLTYLEEVNESSLDGIYASHLVEHMPYEAVLELIRLSHRALQPGGRIVLATPNPRALFAHLELYHLHFGHKAFYHPRLLSFFLDYCGFQNIEDGENPDSGSFCLNNGLTSDILKDPNTPEGISDRRPINYRPEFPPTSNPVRRLSRWGKTIFFKFVVQPFLDDIVGQVNQVLTAHKTVLQRIDALDRPFECYVIGYKPG